jgi:ABC-type transport system involved in multi-copper enzyme maturation permease subunit
MAAVIAKELIDARWRVLIGGLITLLVAVLLAWSYDWIQSLVNSPRVQSQLPSAVQGQLGLTLGSYEMYAWGQWFGRNAPLILGGLAAFLGGGLIAGEVGKGTIFLLLSRPVSRTQVLATKYGVAAGTLLVLNLLGGLALFLAAALLGHPLSAGGVLLSALLLWLGTLFVLGVALLFSILFDDVLRPVGLAVVVGIVVGIPGLIGSFVPSWATWSLPAYWSSLPGYLGTAFPAKEFAVCLITAILPVAVALPLFRSRAY